MLARMNTDRKFFKNVVFPSKGCFCTEPVTMTVTMLKTTFITTAQRNPNNIGLRICSSFGIAMRYFTCFLKANISKTDKTNMVP